MYLETVVSEEELKRGADEITLGKVSELSSDEIYRIMTITQYVTDLCINEIERRGELDCAGDFPMIPYCSDFGVQTILTRLD
jgi:hypothetical protein